jgi:hypothetical protein
VTVTGQLPGVVPVPTFQVQDATPLAFAVCGPSPAAFDGPDRYTTTMVQYAPAFVLTLAVAYDPFATGEVSEVKVRVRVGLGVGLGVDGAAGRGVDGTGVGTAVAASENVGVSTTDSVAAADGVADTPGVVVVAVAVGCASAT